MLGGYFILLHPVPVAAPAPLLLHWLQKHVRQSAVSGHRIDSSVVGNVGRASAC